MKNCFYYSTSIGKIGIAENGEAITNVNIREELLGEDYTVKETPLLAKAAKQLNEYFAGERKSFDLPLYYKSTPFVESVWRALCDIPYGETCSYKDIAVKVGNPKACRAVGMANNRNPIAIVVPCHRVVGADHKLVGYAGGLDMKLQLLTLEKEHK